MPVTLVSVEENGGIKKTGKAFQIAR